MVEDISQKTVVILVILTLIVSVIGTWTVLDQLQHTSAQKSISDSSGKMSLNIVRPKEPTEVSSNGNVGLRIES